MRNMSIHDKTNFTQWYAECVSTSINNGSCGISNNCFWGRGDTYDCDSTRG